MNNLFLENKKKRELTEDQKEERIKRNIERYCKRNDRMLELLEKDKENKILRHFITKDKFLITKWKEYLAKFK